MKEKTYEIDMTKGGLVWQMLLFALPLMLSSILQLLFNAADVIVVGRFAGSASLAAVGSTTSLINLITNLFIGISIGCNVVVSQNYGAKKYELVSKAVHTSIALGLFAGVLLSLIGVTFAGSFLRMMGSPEDVISLATLYLRIYFGGMTATMLYNFGAAVLRAVGDTRRPLFYLSFAGVINVLLNLVFVIKLHMGVAGVGLATVISQCISAALVIRCLFRETGCLKLVISKIRFSSSVLIQILRVGVPAGIQSSLFAVSNVVIQSGINSFGSVVMAGSAAASNIEGFVYMAMNAFMQTSLTFTSQNYGAGNTKRVDKVIRNALIMVTVTGLLLGNLAYLCGPWLLRLYASDAAVIAAGMLRLKCICVVYALCGIMDSLVGVLRGLNCVMIPMFSSLFGSCVLRLVWVATFFQTHHEAYVLYISYAITWIITICAHIVCLVIVRRKAYRRLLNVKSV